MGRSATSSIGYGVILDNFEGDYAEGVYDVVQDKYNSDDDFDFGDWVNDTLKLAGVMAEIDYFGFEYSGQILVVNGTVTEFYDTVAVIDPRNIANGDDDEEHENILQEALTALGFSNLGLEGAWHLYVTVS